MSDVQPEIRFDTVVETEGMRLIAEARGVNESDCTSQQQSAGGNE
jgi:hypothetical protein